MLRERLAMIGGKLSTQPAELLRVTTNPTLQECGDVVYWDNPIPAYYLGNQLISQCYLISPQCHFTEIHKVAILALPD